MALLLFLGCMPVVRGYTQEANEVNVVDMATYQKIKALYEERSRLVSDWENNEERIHEIDAEIEALGVTKMSHQEVLAKFGTEAVPYIDLIETRKINWSDVRVVTNYAGQMLELQVIRATPASSDFILFSTKTKITDSDSKAVAAGKKLFSSAALTLLGKIPKIGPILTNGIEFSEIITHPNTTILEGEYSTYTCQCASEEVAIWVKFQGSTDERQEFCYKGNCVEFECSYAIPASVNIDGMEHTNILDGKIKDIIESEDYTMCETQAAKNFVFYKLYGQELRPDDRVRQITIKTSNKETYFGVPLGEITFMRNDKNIHFCMTAK